MALPGVCKYGSPMHVKIDRIGQSTTNARVEASAPPTFELLAVHLDHPP